MGPERAQKLREVINKKQPDLTVILDNIHDIHNIAAILRTCDAVGVHEVYLSFSPGLKYCKWGKGDKTGEKISGHTLKWLDMHYFDTPQECLDAVRRKYEHVYTTHFCEGASSLYELDLTQSVALVFGNEHTGIDPYFIAQADANFMIPQMGMAQSLNVSVACAVSLYEALRQRDKVGMYDHSRIAPAEKDAMFDDWVRRNTNAFGDPKKRSLYSEQLQTKENNAIKIQACF